MIVVIVVRATGQEEGPQGRCPPIFMPLEIESVSIEHVGVSVAIACNVTCVSDTICKVLRYRFDQPNESHQIMERVNVDSLGQDSSRRSEGCYIHESAAIGLS